jgi:hypothetical protein
MQSFSAVLRWIKVDWTHPASAAGFQIRSGMTNSIKKRPDKFGLFLLLSGTGSILYT